MSDLVSWLLEQVAEDERAAQQLRDDLALYVCEPDGCLEEADGEWSDGEPRLPNHHGCWHGPVLSKARVLAECATKRAIVESLEPALRGADIEISPFAARRVVRMMSLAFADRPGYREEWRP